MKLAGIAIATSMALVFGNQAIGQDLEAEEDLALAYGDRSFVSIATGTRQLARKAPSTATVITAEDIVSIGARNLSEVLETVPGMHVSRNRLQTIYTPTYGMRGILSSTSPHVLMMVNGIPRTSVYLGNPDEELVELPVENIARIEVIRGPGSAVYGADAFAGTINIMTKTAEEIDSTSFGLRAGSFNSWDTWLQHGSKVGDLDVAAYLKIGGTSGQQRQIAVDAVGRSGQVNLGHDDIDGQVDISYGRLRWRAGYTLRNDVGTGVGVAGALDPTGKVRSERITSDLSWTDANFARNLSLTVQAAYMQLANEITTPLYVYPAGTSFVSWGGSAFPDGMIGAPDKWERQARFSAASVYSGFVDHQIRFGVGHDEMEIYKTRENKNFSLLTGVPLLLPGGLTASSGAELFLAPHKRRVNYLYMQDEWRFARDWTLTSGIRHDEYSDFGGTTNPRLALVWEARQDITAKLMYGTAFRAPSFIEMYATGNPIALGNASLMPEKIRTVEAGVTWQARPGLQATLSVFRHHISNLITQTGATYLNGGKQRGSGGEMEATWDASSNVRLTGHYAYQRNIDQHTGKDSGYAPHHHLYTRADWRFISGWNLSGQVNYVADRKRAEGDSRPQIPDYTTVDLTMRTERVKLGWDFSATVYNLFNVDVREPTNLGSGVVYDFPMPGRTFWLQARYSL
ncbi:MAG: TonB-dependent receptor [Betaproteobacteria bacterium HGW-Betaproteobacteria-6]|jgi:iron complex outermembrane receptor protein|nr:MAG: TonB-dependent receptor [Betaproteobacteria bacterium HGW-Betaproteobacteria-6]